MNNKRKCPICGQVYTNYPAISRKDNKTEICSKCGVIEVLSDLEKYKKEYE